MAKLVLDCSLQTKFEQLTKEFATSRDIYAGVLIGVLFRDSWHVVGISKCPKPEANASEPNNERKSQSKLSIRDHIDEEWIVDHARQVNRCLPGGLSVIGIYAFADKQFRLELQSMLTKAVSMTVKVFQKLPNFKDAIKEQLLFYFDGSLKQPAVSLVNLNTGYASAFSAAPTYQAIKFIRISCHVTLDDPLIVLQVDGRPSRNFLKLFATAVSPLFSQIFNAVIVIGPEWKKNSDVLIPKADAKTNYNLTAELFLPLGGVDGNTATQDLHQKCLVVKCQGSIHLKGTMECRAFVPIKASMQEAEAALKEDIVKSLYARTELHYEGMGIIEDEKDDPLALHQLPRRVFAPLIHYEGTVASVLEICDYMFEADTSQDSADGLSELFDIPFNAEDIEDGLENVLSIEQIEQLQLPLPFVDKSFDDRMNSETASIASSCRSRDSSSSHRFNSVISGSKAAELSDAKKRNQILIYLAIFFVIVAIVIAFVFR